MILVCLTHLSWKCFHTCTKLSQKGNSERTSSQSGRWRAGTLHRRVNVCLGQSRRETFGFYESWCSYSGWHIGCSGSKPLHGRLLLLHEPVLGFSFLFVSCTLCCSAVSLNKILHTPISSFDPGFTIGTKNTSIFIHCWYLLCWFSTLES